MKVPNPYICGPPVKGEDFYGREQELRNVLDTDHKLILFLATRRIGKTSLSHQIKYTCETEKEYNSNLCVVWDLQGVRNVRSAKKRLLSPTSKRTLSEKVNWEKLQTLSTCQEVIEAFCDPSYWKLSANKTILLLVDEPDSFLYFAGRIKEEESEEYNFLTDLKYMFDEIPNLRVIIVSTPQIQDLFLCRNIPCLLDNFRIFFLKEFESEQEAEDLIRLSKKTKLVRLDFLNNGESVIKNIIEVSNKVPCYIQQICGYIFDVFPRQKSSQVIKDLIERRIFSHCFTSDFDVLHPIQKFMLLELVNSETPPESQFLIDETKRVASKIKGQVPTLKFVDELVALGILKKFEDTTYYLSNKLFEEWMLHDFENLWNQTIKECEEDIQ